MRNEKQSGIECNLTGRPMASETGLGDIRQAGGTLDLEQRR